MVRDVFRMARENSPAIIFIDEIDAIATKRFDAQTGADREVQRILLELLNQMDGFDQTSNVKVIMATNRADTLDPALLRPGRLDREDRVPFLARSKRAKTHIYHHRQQDVFIPRGGSGFADCAERSIIRCYHCRHHARGRTTSSTEEQVQYHTVRFGRCVLESGEGRSRGRTSSISTSSGRAACLYGHYWVFGSAFCMARQTWQASCIFSAEW